MVAKKLICAGLCVAAFGAARAEPVVNNLDPLLIQRDLNVEYQSFAYEPIQVRNSRTPAGLFNSNMLFLADQIDRNSDREAAKRAVVVTSFANLNDLADASPLGRLIGEQLMHEMKVRGWNVSDIRMAREVVVNDAGEFTLSRDTRKLRETLPAGSVVTGTYLQTIDGILVSARVIDLATGTVVSSAQTRFMKDKFISSLVDKPVKLPVLRVAQ